jgi:hypothetical protein
MDEDLRKKIECMSDEDLIKIVEKDFQNYIPEVINYANEILKSKSLDRPLWYYKKLQDEKPIGPLNRDDIIQLVNEGTIIENDYIWREGMEKWIVANKVNGLISKVELKNSDKTIPPQPPSANTTKTPAKSDNSYIPDSAKYGIRVASVLFLIMVPFWGILALLQGTMSLYRSDVGLAFLAGYNLVITIASIFIGIAIWKLQSWSYSWGVNTGILNIVLYLIQAINGAVILFIFVPIEIAIIVLLFCNREYFKRNSEDNESNISI